MGLFGGPGSVLMAQIRTNVSGYLPGTAVIEAFTPQSDGAGGFTETWTPVPSGTVAARVLPLTFGQVETLAAAEGVRAEYWIILPYTAPVSIGNRVSVGGTAYNVRLLETDQSNIAFVKISASRDV